MTTLADRLLPDQLWQRLQPLLPPPPSHARGGAPRTVPDRPAWPRSCSWPGFGGRGLLARFLYSLPESLVGRRQPGAPPVPAAVADRYALELQALAASLAVPAGDDGPAPLVLDQAAGELLLALERDLEPRLAAGSGDLAHLAGWAAKLAGATCRLAALLHLAGHLRDGWARPIGADTFARAIRLAGYLVEHARAVFDLMGADSRVDDARWLLDWIARTGQTQFTRRDAHRAAPRGRFPKATDLDPALRLLEEHGYLRRVDADPAGPRVAGRPPRGSWSTLCTRRQNLHNGQNLTLRPVVSVL
jgi:replicative DNA helicase